MSTNYASLSSSGEVMLKNPVDTCVIFIVVIALCAGIEMSIQHLSNVQNKYFRVIFGAFLEEVMIVGVLSLLLLFGTSIIPGISDRWMTIFRWMVMCLFFMALFFALIVISMYVRGQFAIKAHRLFEETRQGSDIMFSWNEKRYIDVCKRFKASAAYVSIKNIESLRFADYLAKMQRHNVVQITDLSWKSWAWLSVLVVINVFRSKLTAPNQNVIDVDTMTEFELVKAVWSYILVIGYGTVLLFLILHYTIQQRLVRYLSEEPLPGMGTEPVRKTESAASTGLNTGAADKAAQPKSEREVLVEMLEDPSKNLLMGSIERTLEFIQIVIMWLEWYLSVFALGMVSSIAKNFTPARFFVGFREITILAAIGPPFIFLFHLLL